MGPVYIDELRKKDQVICLPDRQSRRTLLCTLCVGPLPEGHRVCLEHTARRSVRRAVLLLDNLLALILWCRILVRQMISRLYLRLILPYMGIIGLLKGYAGQNDLSDSYCSADSR